MITIFMIILIKNVRGIFITPNRKYYRSIGWHLYRLFQVSGVTHLLGASRGTKRRNNVSRGLVMPMMLVKKHENVTRFVTDNSRLYVNDTNENSL